MGGHDYAEQLLREQLRQNWSARLVYAYGDLSGGDPAARLSVAESWLEQHADDAALLLTLGKISLRNELWGKARGYLESSIARQPAPEAYRLLGSLLDRLEEPDKAAECYRRGIALVVGDTAGIALPEPGHSAPGAVLTDNTV